MLARQQVYHVYLADMPGPRQSFSFLGARMREMFPVVALMGNLTLGVGALSYAGQLNISVVGDRGACPDVDVFADGLRETLRTLGIPVDAVSVEAPSGPVRPTAGGNAQAAAFHEAAASCRQ